MGTDDVWHVKSSQDRAAENGRIEPHSMDMHEIDGARITLHLRSLSGKNGHHVIEASFKGVARSLHDAVRIEGDDVPSTKGTLTG